MLSVVNHFMLGCLLLVLTKAYGTSLKVKVSLTKLQLKFRPQLVIIITIIVYMQIHFNLKNCGFFFIAAFFVYLIYLLIFGAAANPKLPDLSVDIKDLINYCIVAAESGGYAIRQINSEGSYWKKSKGKTSNGVDELLTKADLVSNQLIREHLERGPGLQVRKF